MHGPVIAAVRSDAANRGEAQHLVATTEPALLPGHVVGPALAAAGEHRDAVHPGVVPKPVAGHADLAAAGLEQHRLIEVGPLLDREIKPGIQCCGAG